ncbi:MAG: histidine kinase,Response regulator receiver domain protein,histidine kinase,transcriptional [Bacteroidetes bacterium]|nr:histidine kinase,Response regulator receiver domain protein,histidine kinase,transcriptional [Bacteroidota bacterium]
MPRNPLFDALDRILHPAPEKPPLSARDRMFLNEFHKIVTEQQSNPEFTTEVAAATAGMSRMHLNRKLRALTGQSTHEYILGKRLEIARELLPGPLPIESIVTLVGFKSSSHFGKVFRQRFGITPSAFRMKTSLPREPPGPRSEGK